VKAAIRDGVRRLMARYAPDMLVRLHQFSRSKNLAQDNDTPTEIFLQDQFRQKTGSQLDLSNPRGLSEKLNALKLNPADPLQTLCADKIRVHDYVAEKLGDDVLVPMILATYRLGDINPRKITPDKFVVKTNHDFGGVVICQDRTTFDWTGARVKLADHLAFNHWHRHREPPYRGIKPGLLVEHFLEPDSPEGLREYKIFCFHGVPQFIMVIQVTPSARTKTVFDTTWRPLPVRRRGAPTSLTPIQPPQTLDRMLEAASTLAAPFDFCRIDLYENFGRIRFGEITFYPEGGMDVFEPQEWEQRFGDLLRLDGQKVARTERGTR
jgi:TupA-like ATPgrasp